MNSFRKPGTRVSGPAIALALAVLAAGPVQAMHTLRVADPAPVVAGEAGGDHTVQRDGMSLSEAVESVRRRGDVERIISAETRVSNGREVHHVRAMTKDGKVKTFTMPGRKQD